MKKNKIFKSTAGKIYAGNTLGILSGRFGKGGFLFSEDFIGKNQKMSEIKISNHYEIENNQFELITAEIGGLLYIRGDFFNLFADEAIITEKNYIWKCKVK